MTPTSSDGAKLDAEFDFDKHRPEWLQKWHDTRDRWLHDIGLDIGAAYDVLGLVAFGNGSPDTGFGGDLTVNGTWAIAGEKRDRPLELRFRARTRHAFGDTRPSGVGARDRHAVGPDRRLQ